MNLLSICASLGVIVVIFQWSWLRGVIGVQQGPIESFIPVMLFAIVFGLSMDYEVFLISRIHERWVHTREHSRAVAEGLALTGRVVTAAAAIMVCVFLSFVLGEDRVIKEFGVALVERRVPRRGGDPLPAAAGGPAARGPGARGRCRSGSRRRMPRINIEGSELLPQPAAGASGRAPVPAGAARSRSPGVATEGAEG